MSMSSLFLWMKVIRTSNPGGRCDPREIKTGGGGGGGGWEGKGWGKERMGNRSAYWNSD